MASITYCSRPFGLLETAWLSFSASRSPLSAPAPHPWSVGAQSLSLQTFSRAALSDVVEVQNLNEYTATAVMVEEDGTGGMMFRLRQVWFQCLFTVGPPALWGPARG